MSDSSAIHGANMLIHIPEAVSGPRPDRLQF